MRLLVTGAAGFIGSHLCELLVDQGFAVTGIDGFVDSYSRRDKEANLQALLRAPGFTFAEADLRSAELAAHLDGIDVVVNSAAMAGLPRSWIDIEAYASCNLVAVQRLLEACSRAGVRRFVQISTSSVYGSNAIGDERLPTHPISPYGVTKLAAEHLVLAHRAVHGLPVMILRYFSVYGPRQRPDMAYHIFIESMLEGRELDLFGDGEQSRSNTFAADCVAGTVQALHDGEDGEIYNIGGGEQLTVNQAVTTLSDLLGVTPKIRYHDERPGDQRHTAADISKAQAHFGFEPRTSPIEGLRAQVAWHLDRRATRRDQAQFIRG